MYTRIDKKWFDYCKALGLNPYDDMIYKSEYYIKGFEEWKRLRKEYGYYRYMQYGY